MKYKNNINGILLVNKPKGITSRDVVNEIQKLLNTKAGHTGTLDPMAEGVLVICLGKATKLTEILTSTIKEYEAEVTLGIETDTLDTEGTIIKEDKTKINQEQIINTLKEFEKTYNQEVPKYSAVKVNGKKLYEYARKNEEVILPKKEITIYKQNLLNYNENTFTFNTLVSKGTYIRSLIRDMCYSLNTLGTMSKLIRTKQGKFNIEDTYTLEEIKNKQYEIIKIKDALELETIKVDNKLKQKIINGQKLDLDYDKVLFIDNEDKCLAIYKKENSELKVWKMLY
ncbi:MAG: tRNA pseudouridine(55) synthase TruB [Bacilli bacterium]|nr:tRNA pseudouridine(55) synthase TruB [Bacilli bacterium]